MTGATPHRLHRFLVSPRPHSGAIHLTFKRSEKSHLTGIVRLALKKRSVAPHRNAALCWYRAKRRLHYGHRLNLEYVCTSCHQPPIWKCR